MYPCVGVKGGGECHGSDWGGRARRTWRMRRMWGGEGQGSHQGQTCPGLKALQHGAESGGLL